MERKPEPPWMACAPDGAQCVLEAVKRGAVVGRLVLSGEGDQAPDRHCHLLGRSPLCDFVLDHESISRQHAHVAWDKEARLMLVDLNSAHGTTVDKRVMRPGMTVELKDGSTIAFGASSRSYIVKLRTKEDVAADEAEVEAAKLKGPVQEFRRLCAVQLCTTCGEDGLISSSATFVGPPEVVSLSAVLLDTEKPTALGTHPSVLGTFSTVCRPVKNPLLTQKCCELAQCTQDAVDDAPSLQQGLTRFMEWLSQNGALGGDEHASGDEPQHPQQKPLMVVTLGESAIKRYLPRECLDREIRRPAALAEWLHLRPLFFAHTGLQKLSKQEREQVLGLPTAPEMEALKMLDVLVSASSGAEQPTKQQQMLATAAIEEAVEECGGGAVGAVTAVLRKLISEGCVASSRTIASKRVAAKQAVKAAKSEPVKSRWLDDDDDDDNATADDTGGDKRRKLE